MCRNIKTLFNFEPPASNDEIQAAALQFVRKITGFTKPSQANEAAFYAAVDDIARISAQLLASLQTAAEPKDREVEAARAQARSAQRFGRNNVTLREVQEDDLPILFEHQLDAEAASMAAFPSRGHDAFMAHWAKVLADETVVTRTILLDGAVVGNIGCFGPPEEREVGYWLSKEHWGKGFATRALAAFLDEVRERPLHAHVAKHNIGSLRVLQKCGFTLWREEQEEVAMLVLKLQ